MAPIINIPMAVMRRGYPSLKVGWASGEKSKGWIGLTCCKVRLVRGVESGMEKGGREMGLGNWMDIFREAL